MVFDQSVFHTVVRVAGIEHGLTDSEMNLQPTLLSPEHGDYQRVNSILCQLLPSVLTDPASGLLGELAEDTGKSVDF